MAEEKKKDTGAEKSGPDDMRISGDELMRQLLPGRGVQIGQSGSFTDDSFRPDDAPNAAPTEAR